MAFVIASFTEGYAKVAAKDTPRSFTIAVLPDTQYYSEEIHGGSGDIFQNIVKWIVDNREKENIAYVMHLGDIVEAGNRNPAAWAIASKAMYQLEKPLPGFPEGIPYGLAVGNHDQQPSQYAKTGSTKFYNQYFGVDHFKGRKYYGGHFGDDNDTHYDLFSACGLNFIVIYIEYDSFNEQQAEMNAWASSLLDKYHDRKAIIVTHALLSNNPVAGSNIAGQAPFGRQAQRIYEQLKGHDNIVMMIGGHVGDNGEGFRQDTYNGHCIKSFLCDYQNRPLGGNGMMRLYTFDLQEDKIKVRSLSPYQGYEETDADSKFEVPFMRMPSASRMYDFNGDGKTDPVTYDRGNWLDAEGKVFASVWNCGGVAVPACVNDYIKTAPLVYKANGGFFLSPEGNRVPFGEAMSIPVPADYSGDGIADLATWNPETAIWHVQGQEDVRHGWKASVPVPADYDGDGRTDIAVWRLKNHTWYIHGVGNVPFGQDGDVPVPADYNGDGRAEMAVWRPSTGEWLIYGQDKKVKLGRMGNLPVPGDYLGKGYVQKAVFDQEAQRIVLEDGTKIKMKGSLEQIVNFPYAIRRYYLQEILKK
jgi:hypothetical protein